MLNLDLTISTSNLSCSSAKCCFLTLSVLYRFLLEQFRKRRLTYKRTYTKNGINEFYTKNEIICLKVVENGPVIDSFAQIFHIRFFQACLICQFCFRIELFSNKHNSFELVFSQLLY